MKRDEEGGMRVREGEVRERERERESGWGKKFNMFVFLSRTFLLKNTPACSPTRVAAFST